MTLDSEIRTLETKKEEFVRTHEARMAKLDAIAKKVDAMISSNEITHKESMARLDEINALLDTL